MAELSPAAQAVRDAVLALYHEQARDMAWAIDSSTVAAALRAAADQVVPEEPWPVSMMGPVYVAEARQRRKLRSEILSLATELDPIQ